MSRIWRLRSNRSALYSRGEADLPYAPNAPATIALTRLVGKAFYTVLPEPPAPETGMMFTDAAPAWLPGPGETLLDNMSPLATKVNAWDYTSSRDIVAVLNAVGTARGTAPTYVQLDSGRYYMNSLRNYAPQNIAGNWVGYLNTIPILGMVGSGVGVDGDGLPKLNTEIVFSASMISNSSSQVTSQGVTPYDYALNPSLTAPVPITAFYFSDNNRSAPLFFSGIHFIGQLQTPFGVYSANAQTKFQRNQGVAAPLPWDGFSIWRAQPGSRFQFSKFTGVGFALNSAPPYEKCAVGTNYCDIDAYKIDIDGRTSAEFDPLRRRAGGAWMLNKSINERINYMSIKYTRRSGFAFNTNTHSTTEKISVKNHEFTNISNFGAEDPWPSDVRADFATPAGFNNYNIEGHMGTYYIENGHCNSAHGHVSFATSAGYNWDENRPYLYVKNFRTDDTSYNKMLRISTQTPNSSIYSRLAADFSLTERWFDIRRLDGYRLAPVKASVFNQNPSLYGPNTHYLMRTF